MPKSLFVCQGKSVATGLSFTNWILNHRVGEVEVVESSILPGGGFLIIAQGESNALQALHDQAVSENQVGAMRCLLIKRVHGETLPAFYSLQNEIPVDASLMICECKNVLDAFVIANEAALSNSEIHILDIRNGRGTSGVPLVILAGVAAALRAWDTEMSSRAMGELDHRAFIEKPHPQFMELFV